MKLDKPIGWAWMQRLDILSSIRMILVQLSLGAPWPVLGKKSEHRNGPTRYLVSVGRLSTTSRTDSAASEVRPVVRKGHDRATYCASSSVARGIRSGFSPFGSRHSRCLRNGNAQSFASVSSCSSR